MYAQQQESENHIANRLLEVPCNVIVKWQLTPAVQAPET